jgi:histidine triad (HIT) family protein
MCRFCDIVSKDVAAQLVLEDQISVAFLDHRPLRPGHCLLIPRGHYETLADLPQDVLAPFFRNAQRLCVAVESSMEALGTFVAMNNKVSQSVPHLHVHVVPRRPRDGLRGFFWPRHSYRDESEKRAIAQAIRTALVSTEGATP